MLHNRQQFCCSFLGSAGFRILLLWMHAAFKRTLFLRGQQSEFRAMRVRVFGRTLLMVGLSCVAGAPTLKPRPPAATPQSSEETPGSQKASKSDAHAPLTMPMSIAEGTPIK